MWFAARRIHDAGELGKHTIACVLDDLATMFADLGISETTQTLPEPDVCSFLVKARQATISTLLRQPSGSRSHLPSRFAAANCKVSFELRHGETLPLIETFATKRRDRSMVSPCQLFAASHKQNRFTLFRRHLANGRAREH